MATKEEDKILSEGGYFRGAYNMCEKNRVWLARNLNHQQLDDVHDIYDSEYRPRMLSEPEQKEVVSFLKMLKCGEYLGFGDEEEARFCLDDILKALGMV